MSDADARFEAGESLYVFSDGTNQTVDIASVASSDATSPVGTSGETINLKLIDVNSQQMIADMNVNF
jgi:hypothetical protein